MYHYYWKGALIREDSNSNLNSKNTRNVAHQKNRWILSGQVNEASKALVKRRMIVDDSWR